MGYVLDSRSWDGWQRLSRSVLEQVADDDPAALAQLIDHLDWINGQLPDVVARLRGDTADSHAPIKAGYSWAQIAQALGVTRQSAQRRFGRTRAQH